MPVAQAVATTQDVDEGLYRPMEPPQDSVAFWPNLVWASPEDRSGQPKGAPITEAITAPTVPPPEPEDQELQRLSGVVGPRHLRLKTPAHYINLQSWEGTVLSVETDSFWARLVDERGGPDLQAEIPGDEISDDDRELVTPGAVFYWHIGYEVAPSGQRKRNSTIRFRRLPAWTRRELAAAALRAEEVLKALGGE